MRTSEFFGNVDGVYLYKNVLPPDNETAVQFLVYLDSLVFERMVNMVKGSMNSQVSLTVFVEGFKLPFTVSLNAVFLYDDWKDLADWYLRMKANPQQG